MPVRVYEDSAYETQDVIDGGSLVGLAAPVLAHVGKKVIQKAAPVIIASAKDLAKKTAISFAKKTAKYGFDKVKKKGKKHKKLKKSIKQGKRALTSLGLEDIVKTSLDPFEQKIGVELDDGLSRAESLKLQAQGLDPNAIMRLRRATTRGIKGGKVLHGAGLRQSGAVGVSPRGRPKGSRNKKVGGNLMDDIMKWTDKATDDVSDVLVGRKKVFGGSIKNNYDRQLTSLLNL